MGFLDRMRGLSDSLFGNNADDPHANQRPGASSDNAAAAGAPAVSPCEKDLSRELARRARENGEDVRYALLFSGDVQGVGFRWTNQGFANEHRLSGWARNLDDGTVEMELQGPPAAISEHLARVHAYYRRFHNRIWLEHANELPIDTGARGFSVRY